MQSLGGTRKRKSDQLDMSGDAHFAADSTTQTVLTKGDMSHPDEGPAKRQRMGLTLAQKQALIDNLQLEITERARKLRANYNIHAQSLRTRIEIRVNRIPLALRKLTMEELLERCAKEVQQKPSLLTSSLRGPPVPAKDVPVSRPPTRGGAAPAHPPKRRSHEISGVDKENEVRTPPKKARADGPSVVRNPNTHVLSPTTVNSRVAPRPATAGAPNPARPGTSSGRSAATPGRAALASSVLNRMVDGTTRNGPAARSGAVTPGPATGRKTPGPGAGSTASSSITASERRRRGATVTAGVQPPQSTTRPLSQIQSTTRRVSGASESSNVSEGSTSTVIRKRPMTAPPGAHPKLLSLAGGSTQTSTAAKRTTVMGTIKKGVASAVGTAGAKKGGSVGKAAGAAVAAGTASGSAAGRVLRKR
ncbi:hypothetical protein VTJ83DRAFT_5939 [Remersonia thermophila]|uniref:Borealin N-terminal domain-containing protein n=1 Tax=Remersonia thermophila TaxID=72144 RepID=A0ABR4D8A1_9PEZI